MSRLLASRYLGIAVLVLGLAIFYVALPLWLAHKGAPDRHYSGLAAMAALAISAMIVGFKLPWLDARFASGAPRFGIHGGAFQALIWGSFILFALVVIATARRIPLLSALQGASELQLSVERGDFLKTRTGWQAAFVYISAIYVGALLPYATARLFIQRHPLRFAAVSTFLLYALLALEKSAFIFVLGPLVWLALRRADYRAAVCLLALSAAILYTINVLARGGVKNEPTFSMAPTQFKASRGANATQADYFSLKYDRKGAIDHIIWRAIVVPVVTAGDALRVFEEKFNGRHFRGATSSFLAKVAGQKRVNYDAEVFTYQYGNIDIGRSNTVYIIEAFVNFGWLGVIAFSLFIGQGLRWFFQTADEAIHVMWPLFCFFIFIGGLIPTLLSNGYAAIFAIALFGRPYSRAEGGMEGHSRTWRRIGRSLAQAEAHEASPMATTPRP